MRFLHRPSDGESGIVLIAALWLLILLSITAAGMIELVRSERRIARHIVNQAEAEALADGGIAHGVAALLERGRRGPWPLDGRARVVDYQGRSIRVSVYDELGKIDLNTATDELLRGLFRSAGLSAAEAELLVDRIADWRDPDDLRRLGGAERPDYEAKQLIYGPRNGAFESVDELGQVLGMPASLLDRVRPALTVFSRRSGVETATAPREALAALPGMDEVQIRQLMAERGLGDGWRTGDSRASTAGTTASLPDLTGRAFTLTAHARGQNGQAVARTAIVRFTGNPDQPFWIHEWR